MSRAKACDGKKAWSKRSAAANVAKSMRQRHTDPFIDCYRCDFCGKFHVGHIPGTNQMRDDLLRLAKVGT